MAFEYLILLIIILNSITLAISGPNGSETKYENWFLWIYTIEMIMRIIA